ncbi:GMC family oxidoreductase [Pseudomonas sp. TE3610]
MADALSADVVVIGSGIVGATAARRLAQRGASVLILEAGGEIEHAKVVEAFRASPRKHDWLAPYPYHDWAPHPIYQPEPNGYLDQAGPYPYETQYIRGVGGTSWHWAAQAWRLLPNDFHMKSLYGVGRDWPISYAELEPFYQDAETLMGVSGAANTGSPRSQPLPMAPVAEPYAMSRIRERLAPAYSVVGNTAARNSQVYDGRPPCCASNSCQPICPINAQYHGGIAIQQALAAGVRLQTRAVVYRLEHDAQGRIVAAHYYDPDKQSHRVTGQTFILAANGIESPKLLLMSATDRYPHGLANGSGQVGRNLMDHPSTSLSFDADEELWLGRGPQSPSSINTLRDGDFRRHRAAYRLDFTNVSRVDTATEALLKAGVYGVEFKTQLRHRAAFEMSVKDVLELLPHPDNRVTLSDRRDKLGLPTPRLHYAIDDYTRRGAEASRQDFLKIAQMMGGTNLRHSKEGAFSNNQHITGTLGMGSDPATSVCDGVGRAHQHDNLFLCGTGVMPTSATVNSTLTAVALSLRSAGAIIDKQS